MELNFSKKYVLRFEKDIGLSLDAYLVQPEENKKSRYSQVSPNNP